MEAPLSDPACGPRPGTPPDALLETLIAKDAWLRAEARRVASSRDEAADLVQEAWLAALHSRPSPDRDLEPWLGRVLRNQGARARRNARRANFVANELEHDGARAEAADEPVVGLEWRRKLRAAVEALDEPYRSTLRQRFFEDRSVSEIAELSTEPRATISTRLRRGLERLRRTLERSGLALPSLFTSLWDRRALSETTLSRAGAVGKASSVTFAGLGALAVALSVTLWGATRWVFVSSPAASLDLVRASEEPPRERRDATAQRELAAANVRERAARPVAAETSSAEPAPLAVSASLEGRLVAEDGTPLGAGMRVWLSRTGGPVVERVTDATGRFEVPAELARSGEHPGGLPRVLVAELPDAPSALHGGCAPRFFVEPDDDGRWVVVAGAGPVVRVVLPPGAPAGALSDPRALRISLRGRRPGAIVFPPVRHGPAAVSGERELVVQLASGLERGAAEYALLVTQPDGLAGDSLALDAEALAGTRPLQARWRRLSAAAITVETADGEPVGTGAIWLRPLAEPTAWVLQPDARGRGLLDGLAPGAYELSAAAPAFTAFRTELELAPGVLTAQRAQVVALASPRVVSGRLTSVSGEYHEPIVVALEGSGQPQFAQTEWALTEDGWVGTFDFPSVPAGAHRLAPVTIADHRTIEPAGATVTAGGPPLAFLCRDDLPSAALDFVASEADGRPVESFSVDVSIEGIGGGPRYTLRRLPADTLGPERWSVATHGLAWTTRTGPALVGLPLGAQIAWEATAHACEPARGTAVSIDGGRIAVEFRPR